MLGVWEGPRRTSKLASLLTQLLGKAAEAMLMHAKACNLPVLHVSAASCSALYKEALGSLLVNSCAELAALVLCIVSSGVWWC